jgi:hypothetical protein
MHLLFTILIILACFGAPFDDVWQPTKVNLLMNPLQETGGHNNVLAVAFYTREGGGYVSSNISKALPRTYAIVYKVFVVVFLWQCESQ